MPKASWGAIDGSPFEDELEEYEVYDGDMPPKGLYRMRLKLLRLKTNNNGDPMLNGLVLVNEPAGSKKAQYNGYDTWFNLNVTKQGARWVNNFLSVLVPENKVAALRKAFWAQKVMLDKEEPPNIISIGGVKITENMLLSATLVYDSYGDGAMKPKTFSRPSDTTLNEEGLDSAEGDEEDWEETEGEADDSAEDDEEFEGRAAELEGMTRAQLLKAAKELSLSIKRGTDEDEIIELILAEEFPEDEDGDEEPDEDEDLEDDEEEEEVAEDEEEEPEEEPEPPKRTRRTRDNPNGSSPAKAASRRRAPAKEEPEPPARARTGRRRKAGSGKPPF